MTTDIIHIIAEAAGQITAPYLRLVTTYEPTGIVRERVFCYELYHQIRILLGKDNKITLNGEIDKRGHVDFANGDKRNPDFVFHIPGTHLGNTVVMEIKGKMVDEIMKDFETLLIFTNKYQYQSGVFLLYNHSIKELTEQFSDKLKKMTADNNADKIYVITLPQSNKVEGIFELNKLLKQP